MKKLAITMGDPCGIGPEIIIKACLAPEISGLCDYTVFGSREIFINTADLLGINLPDVFLNKIHDIPGKIGFAENIGTVNASAGQMAFDSVRVATENLLNNNREYSALVTAPINKESLKLAHVPFIGHTEILGGLTNTENPLTMFETLGLRVFFLSRHVSLRQACDLVTEENIYSYIKNCSRALANLDAVPGSLAIAGLNPHSGEHGLFGNEEEQIVRAVSRAQSEGYNVVGPVSADSVFHRAKIGKYSAVLSLYHDQGHIAAKTLDFERTVSLTLGLPFLRTSVDHGTAFDIAGKNIASPVSMKEAIRVALKYA